MSNTERSTPEPDLARRLREADAREIVRILEQEAEDLDVPSVRQALRNPFLTREAIERLLEIPHLISSYEIRRDLALHPRTPEIRALRFVPGLFWRDLVRLGGDTRVPPQVRRLADQQLTSRLPGLALGERISIARIAGVGVVGQLRHDPHPRVLGAVLENPRMTEGLLMSVVQSESTASEILELIGRSSRWGIRYTVRGALVRNPRTPVQTALGLLPSLKKHDLRELVRDRRGSAPVRKRARVLLGDDV